MVIFAVILQVLRMVDANSECQVVDVLFCIFVGVCLSLSGHFPSDSPSVENG